MWSSSVKCTKQGDRWTELGDYSCLSWNSFIFKCPRWQSLLLLVFYLMVSSWAHMTRPPAVSIGPPLSHGKVQSNMPSKSLGPTMDTLNTRFRLQSSVWSLYTQIPFRQRYGLKNTTHSLYNHFLSALMQKKKRRTFKRQLDSVTPERTVHPWPDLDLLSKPYASQKDWNSAVKDMANQIFGGSIPLKFGTGDHKAVASDDILSGAEWQFESLGNWNWFDGEQDHNQKAETHKLPVKASFAFQALERELPTKSSTGNQYLQSKNKSTTLPVALTPTVSSLPLFRMQSSQQVLQNKGGLELSLPTRQMYGADYSILQSVEGVSDNATPGSPTSFSNLISLPFSRVSATIYDSTDSTLHTRTTTIATETNNLKEDISEMKKVDEKSPHLFSKKHDYQSNTAPVTALSDSLVSIASGNNLGYGETHSSINPQTVFESTEDGNVPLDSTGSIVTGLSEHIPDYVGPTYRTHDFTHSNRETGAEIYFPIASGENETLDENLINVTDIPEKQILDSSSSWVTPTHLTYFNLDITGITENPLYANLSTSSLHDLHGNTLETESKAKEIARILRVQPESSSSTITPLYRFTFSDSNLDETLVTVKPQSITLDIRTLTETLANSTVPSDAMALLATNLPKEVTDFQSIAQSTTLSLDLEEDSLQSTRHAYDAAGSIIPFSSADTHTSGFSVSSSEGTSTLPASERSTLERKHPQIFGGHSILDYITNAKTNGYQNTFSHSFNQSLSSYILDPNSTVATSFSATPSVDQGIISRTHRMKEQNDSSLLKSTTSESSTQTSKHVIHRHGYFGGFMDHTTSQYSSSHTTNSLLIPQATGSVPAISKPSAKYSAHRLQDSTVAVSSTFSPLTQSLIFLKLIHSVNTELTTHQSTSLSTANKNIALSQENFFPERNTSAQVSFNTHSVAFSSTVHPFIVMSQEKTDSLTIPVMTETADRLINDTVTFALDWKYQTDGEPAFISNYTDKDIGSFLNSSSESTATSLTPVERLPLSTSNNTEVGNVSIGIRSYSIYPSVSLPPVTSPASLYLTTSSKPRKVSPSHGHKSSSVIPKVTRTFTSFSGVMPKTTSDRTEASTGVLKDKVLLETSHPITSTSRTYSVFLKPGKITKVMHKKISTSPEQTFFFDYSRLSLSRTTTHTTTTIKDRETIIPAHVNDVLFTSVTPRLSSLTSKIRSVPTKHFFRLMTSQVPGTNVTHDLGKDLTKSAEDLTLTSEEPLVVSESDDPLADVRHTFLSTTISSVVVMPLNFHLIGILYTEQLQNVTSEEYMRLEREVKLVMNKIFSTKYLNEYIQSSIVGFRNGSVSVQTHLVFSRKTSTPSNSDLVRTVVTDISERQKRYFKWNIEPSSVESNGYTLKNLEPEILSISFLVLRGGFVAVSKKPEESKHFLESFKQDIIRAVGVSFPVRSFHILHVRDLRGDLEVKGKLYLNTKVHTDARSVLPTLLSLGNGSVDLSSIRVDGYYMDLQVFPISFRVKNRLFNVNLLDLSSFEFQDLSKDLSAVVLSSLRSSGPLQVIIREVMSGSVLCKGDIIYRFPAPGSGEILRGFLGALGTDGTLGSSSYKLEPKSLQVGDSSFGPDFEYPHFPGFGVAIIVMCGLCILIFPVLVYVCFKTRMLGHRKKVTIQRLPDPDRQSRHFEMDNQAFRASIEQP